MEAAAAVLLEPLAPQQWEEDSHGQGGWLSGGRGPDQHAGKDRGAAQAEQEKEPADLGQPISGPEPGYPSRDGSGLGREMDRCGQSGYSFVRLAIELLQFPSGATQPPRDHTLRPRRRSFTGL